MLVFILSKGNLGNINRTALNDADAGHFYGKKNVVYGEREREIWKWKDKQKWLIMSTRQSKQYCGAKKVRELHAQSYTSYKGIHTHTHTYKRVLFLQVIN